MNPLATGQMVVMKGSNGAVAEFGSSSRHSPNMQDDHNSLFDVLSQNTPDSDIARIRDDEVYSNKSGSENNEGVSADDDQDPKNRKRKKRYNRHTQHQIQEMEAFFRECPHPDDKQRKELARELGLEPLQVKFWFQNKRTQVKNQHERSENTMLRAENEKLRAENIRYKEAISNASCPTCGGPTTVSEMAFEEHNLRLENARLRDEINRLSVVAAKYVGKSLNSVYSPPPPLPPSLPPSLPPIMPMPSLDLGVGSLAIQAGDLEMLGSGDLLIRPAISGFTEADKPLIIKIAVSAMDELVKIAQIGSPLWIPGPDNITHEVLSEEDYCRAFPKGAGRREGVRAESSRGNALVMMNHFNLIEILMDANQWSTVFSPIVSRGTTLEVLSTGIAGNYNGALQVMTAEFHLPSPLVPTRESLFVRYCKQHNDGTWAVADVSLDHHLHPTTSNCFRRLPSGCLIQEMPNGFSQVIWIEHVEVEYESCAYNMFKETVQCGLAFGAKRWIATLNRQAERLASAMATQVLPGEVVGVLTSLEGRKSMLKLAERMVRSFCSGVSASTIQLWATLCGSGDEEVKVTSRKSINDPGRPAGIVLSVATTFWLPIPPKTIFDFLRDENTRSEWDILSNGGFVHEIARIANGQDPGNCISLLRVNGSNANQGNMLIIQESCIDESGCLVVYAPVDGASINAVLNGHDDPDYVALLPSGFAVVPDGSNTTTTSPEGGILTILGSGGSLLTVAFQILVSSIPTSKLDVRSVATVNSLINCTVSRIKAALSCNNNA